MNKDHTFISILDSIHNFKPKSRRVKINNRGLYRIYKCQRCKISGIRYGNSESITISKLYSQERFPKCKKMTNNYLESIGKYIKLLPININLSDLDLLPIQTYQERDTSLYVGSVHRVINPEDSEKDNDSRGVWINGRLEPIKIFNSELEFIERKSRRTKYKKKFKRKSRRTI